MLPLYTCAGLRVSLGASTLIGKTIDDGLGTFILRWISQEASLRSNSVGEEGDLSEPVCRMCIPAEQDDARL